ncbi:MAG: EamA family transporter [Lachnospiraceae bacterium]|nr:EamA family transporter [Lachnospiraceae bacterium]
MWLVYALLSALFAGITAILAKMGIRNTDSHLATALRTIVVLVFAWLMAWITAGGAGGAEPGAAGVATSRFAALSSELSQISGKTFLFLMLSGLTTGGSWICYFKALQLGDVNKVAPIDKSSTILTMLLAFLFLGESLTVIKVIAMIIMGVGTYLMIQKKENSQQQRRDTNKMAGIWKANSWLLYALLSAVFASLTTILGKIGISGIDSNLGTAIRTIFVLLMAWVIVFALGRQKEIRQIDRKSWLFLGLSGIATGLSWLCYYRALQDGNASIVAPIDKLSIVVTVAFSWIFLKEKLSGRAMVGLAGVVGGTLLLLV